MKHEVHSSLRIDGANITVFKITDALFMEAREFAIQHHKENSKEYGEFLQGYILKETVRIINQPLTAKNQDDFTSAQTAWVSECLTSQAEQHTRAKMKQIEEQAYQILRS